MRVSFYGLVLPLFGVACGTTTEHDTAAERGARIADDPHGVSASQFNAFACTTCHAKPGDATGRLFPGAPLEGAASRPTFWGGPFTSLGDAVGECVTHFQRASSFEPTTPSAEDLYSWLVSIGGSGTTGAVPFTVVSATKDLAPGDPSHGAALWDRACRSCHGAAHTGEGRLSPLVSKVPEDTQAFHGSEGPTVIREVVIEKIRTGSYLGFAGTMPPFASQTLSDADVAGLLSYLGLYP